MRFSEKFFNEFRAKVENYLFHYLSRFEWAVLDNFKRNIALVYKMFTIGAPEYKKKRSGVAEASIVISLSVRFF